MGIPEPSNLSGSGPDPARPSGKVSLWVYAGSILAWLGICVCFLLLQEESGLRSFLCANKEGCDAVLHSQFARIKDVPLPWLGAGFYAGSLLLWLGVSATANPPRRRRMLEVILWLQLAGFTFSLGLMYLQFFVLHAFCPLCTTSAVVMTALLGTAIQAKRAEEISPGGASPRGAFALALFAIIAATAFLGNLFARPASPAGLWLADLSTAHRIGSAEAPVQIIVYSDFQCGFCRQLHGVLQQLEKEYPRDLTIVFRHFPLASHARALPAAIASECAAEQGVFWQYSDKLFTEGGDLSDARLRELASSLGIDMGRFDECLKSESAWRPVTRNLREAEVLGLPGTPSVFVNGRPLAGPPSYENLRKQIEEQLHVTTSSADRPR